MALINDASGLPASWDGDARGHKRKRDEIECTELDRRPFTIRPDSSVPLAAPRVFAPICLLSRGQLPLAYLDTSGARSRLFVAFIRILENGNDFDGDANVLIAEEEKEKRIYAIERAHARTYALCRLGPWVTKKQIESSAKVILKRDESETKRRALRPAEHERAWWSRATVALPEPVTPRHNELGGGRPILSMRSKTASTNDTTMDVRTNASDPQVDLAATVPAPAEEANMTISISAPEALQDLAKHYLEALYLSRTSLAYFTKGPLSRARAAFSGRPDKGLQPADLIAFLRDALLSASVMDKKYRETINGMVKDFPPSGLETPDQPAKTQKKKRKWKSKRDKAGFFVDEKDYLQKWWRSQDGPDGAQNPDEAKDASLRRRVPRLRSRETFLQVILALEVLALEAAHPTQDDGQRTAQGVAGVLHGQERHSQDTQGVKIQTQEPSEPPASKKQKVKKPAELSALLETLVDRLCIWHSLESHSPAKDLTADGHSANGDANDELKSFCIEVIIPFYMSRLSQRAAAVNKKLGGPSAPTPMKRKSMISAKPGEPAVRKAPEHKPRKPLSRVSSEALNHGSRPAPLPSLHRSATDTDALLPRIKGESSETSVALHSIPPAKLPQPRKRTSLMHSLGLNKREVDFSAASRANEAKMRKKAEVDQKLQEAISALKKPNRALAVKEVATSTDASFAKAVAKARPSAGQRKKSDSHSGVHVVATPKHSRTINATPGRHMEVPKADSVRSATSSYVPSSSARATSQLNFEPPSNSFAVPQSNRPPKYAAASTNVEDTPVRGFAKFIPSGLTHEPGTLLDSPVTARRNIAAVQQTPSKSKPPSPPAALLLESPSSGSTAELPRTDEVTNMEPQQGVRRPHSLYDALGWDDDYEELA